LAKYDLGIGAIPGGCGYFLVLITGAAYLTEFFGYPGFEDLVIGILSNSLKSFNPCIFSYSASLYALLACLACSSSSYFFYSSAFLAISFSLSF